MNDERQQKISTPNARLSKRSKSSLSIFPTNKIGASTAHIFHIYIEYGFRVYTNANISNHRRSNQMTTNNTGDEHTHTTNSLGKRAHHNNFWNFREKINFHFIQTIFLRSIIFFFKSNFSFTRTAIFFQTNSFLSQFFDHIHKRNEKNKTLICPQKGKSFNYLLPKLC